MTRGQSLESFLTVVFVLISARGLGFSWRAVKGFSPNKQVRMKSVSSRKRKCSKLKHRNTENGPKSLKEAGCAHGPF